MTAAVGVLLMEFGDLAMCRKMLRGITARSESLAGHSSNSSDRWSGSKSTMSSQAA